MKKLFLLFLLSSMIYAQKEPLHTGELIINLTNQGSSWNVTFTLTAISARWNKTDNLTNDYETASVYVHSPDPPVAYFDHIWDVIAGINPIFSAGLYKISAIENGVEKACFYMDWRTSTLGWNSSLDVYFKYDFGNKHFKNAANTQIIDHSYQTLWNLTSNLLETTGLEGYWNNCLAVFNNGENHPKLVWGPYPSNSISIQAYKVYRKYGSSPFAPCTTLSANAFQFTDESVSLSIPGGQAGTDVQYKVTAIYNTNNETTSTNTITVNIQGSEIEKRSVTHLYNKDYNLEQNYPNQFNSTTTINYSIPVSTHVSLKLFDIIGREVVTLVNEQQEAETFSIDFDASKLTSRICFYQILEGKYLETCKLIL